MLPDTVKKRLEALDGAERRIPRKWNVRFGREVTDVPGDRASRSLPHFIDGRRMDAAVDGVHWWSLIILEGYSRTMLAGMMAPTEATWVALMVLYTACLRYGAPVHLVSDSGGPIRRL